MKLLWNSHFISSAWFSHFSVMNSSILGYMSSVNFVRLSFVGGVRLIMIPKFISAKPLVQRLSLWMKQGINSYYNPGKVSITAFVQHTTSSMDSVKLKISLKWIPGFLVFLNPANETLIWIAQIEKLKKSIKW